MLITKRSSISERLCRGESLPPAPFIVGVGRSGTTMFRLMLDAHPELAIPPETIFRSQVRHSCELASDSRAGFLENLTSHINWEDFHIRADSLKQRIAEVSPFNISDALRAFYQLYAERFGKPRWGDRST